MHVSESVVCVLSVTVCLCVCLFHFVYCMIACMCVWCVCVTVCPCVCADISSSCRFAQTCSLTGRGHAYSQCLVDFECFLSKSCFSSFFLSKNCLMFSKCFLSNDSIHPVHNMRVCSVVLCLPPFCVVFLHVHGRWYHVYDAC